MTVDALLESTAMILKESGFDALSCNAIAERAGISIGSLYQYFASKEAIVAELRRRHFHEVNHALQTALREARGQSFVEQLRAVVAANVRSHAADPELHYLLTERYRDVGFDLDAVEPKSDPTLLYSDAVTESLIREYSYARDTAENAAVVVFTLVESLTHMALVYNQVTLDEPALIDEIMIAALGYLEKRAIH